MQNAGKRFQEEVDVRKIKGLLSRRKEMVNEKVFSLRNICNTCLNKREDAAINTTLNRFTCQRAKEY